MKKTLLLLLTLLLVFASSACSNSSDANVGVAGVTVFYGKPIELAKEEFETIFTEYEGLKITETATLDRTDDANNMSYRSPIHPITVMAFTALSFPRIPMETGKSCNKVRMLPLTTS